MTNPRKHHWVPQFYLRAFAYENNPERIFAIKTKTGEILIVNIKDAAAERDLYAYTPESGEKDTKSTEEQLAKMESIISPLLNRIHQREPIDEELKTGIAMFAGLQMTRTPMMRDKMSKMMGEMIKQTNEIVFAHEDYIDRMFQEMKQETGFETEVTIQDLIEFVERGEYDVTVDDEYSMRMGLQMLEEVTKIFYSMNWAFLSPNTEKWKYITGDNPYGLMNPDLFSETFKPVGLINEETTIHMPLSPTLYALGSWKGESGYFNVPENVVREFNIFTISRAERFVYSHFKNTGISNLIKKYQRRKAGGDKQKND